MKLLTPVDIGTTTVKNRVVSTAHGAFFDFYSPQSEGVRCTGLNFHTSKTDNAGLGYMARSSCGGPEG